MGIEAQRPTLDTDVDELAEMIEGQRIEGRAAVIAARRQHIRDMARCEDCGSTERECRANRGKDPTAPPWFGCCFRVLVGVPCRHREDPDALRVLLDEAEAGGRIRTVAEVDPPPVLGPHPVTTTWLLEQDTWWYPHRRPAVRVAEMDKPWRLNAARFLERCAATLEAADGMRDIWSDAPDEVWTSLTHRDPLDRLREQPLMRALRRGLPDGGRKLRLLEARAVHWNTCPMRLAHPAKTDRCLCLREGRRVVGATNDPATVRAAQRRFTESAERD